MAQVKRSVTQGPALSEVIISPSPYHLSKSDFRHQLILPVLFSRLLRDPRLPSPTSFDGVKPSYVEWSEVVLTFLSVTDYHEFVPILQAVAGHKDVITKKVFIEGVLSELVEEIKDKNLDLEAVTSGARVVDDQDAEVTQRRNQSSRRKEKFKGAHTHENRQFSQVCSASLNIRRSKHHHSSHHENVKLRLGCSHRPRNLASSGCHLCRFSSDSSSHTPQADHDSIGMESRKSPNVLQMYHHWLERISKYESLSSEKIASNIKITLALQNVRGPLANALSLSITEKSTWNDIHNPLINYFDNNIPSDTKEIYQFDVNGKVSKEDSVARSPRRIQ